MGQRQFVLFGIVGVIALVVGITVASLNDNLTYYLYPNEAVAQRAEFPDGERFRLAGQVVAVATPTELQSWPAGPGTARDCPDSSERTL
jgi:cytochrome c-type biogenesis protein CcmE